MIDWEKATILEGEKVKLVPLALEHRDALLNAAKDGKLWELWFTSVPSEDTIDKYLETALNQQENKSSLAFTILDKKTNSVVGSTRYCNIEISNRRLEIGYTWYAKSSQRTGINTECKYLLLKNAFENYKAIAVEFRTHWQNHKSRNAILRLGAKQDGILRNHRILGDGSLRDTVVYSIIKSEWKTVERSLKYEMIRYK